MDIDFEHILDKLMNNGEDHEDAVMSEPMSGKFSSLKIFGSIAYYLIPDDKRKSKLSDTGKRCLFMGVSTTGFVVLDLETLQTVEVRTIKIDDGTFMD